jgi:hypothetical protein
MKIILIAKIISLLGVSPEIKKDITHCTLYGVKKAHKIDIHARLKVCIKQFTLEE